METEEGYFSFTVKTEFSDSHTRFNQCGTVLVVVGPIIVLKILSTVRPLTKCVSATCTKSRENPFRSQCLFPWRFKFHSGLYPHRIVRVSVAGPWWLSTWSRIKGQIIGDKKSIVKVLKHYSLGFFIPFCAINYPKKESEQFLCLKSIIL